MKHINFIGFVTFFVIINSTVFASVKCELSFQRKVASKYTNEQFPEIFNSSELSIKSTLGAGGNGKVYLLENKNENAENIALKIYTDKVEGNSSLEFPNLTPEMNMTLDLLRFAEYRSLKRKYDLDFELIEIYNAKENMFLAEFVDGVPAHSLKKLGLSSFIKEYNQMLISLFHAVVREASLKGESLVFYDIGKMTSVGRGFGISKALGRDASELIHEINKYDFSDGVLKLRFMFLQANGEMKPYVIDPGNFIYSFDRSRFVMIDPI